MSSEAGALSGVRVIDLSQGIAGPYCGRLLAGYGADVIKVEPMTGDVARRYGPFPGDRPHPERSGTFLFLNQAKRGMVLELGSRSAAGVLLDLVRGADIVLESERPGTLARWGVGYEALARANPKVVLVSVTDFGQDGPYAGYRGCDIVDYALSGLMFITGNPEREPLITGGSIAEFVTGETAHAAALAAYLRAERDGDGDHVDVSIVEANMGIEEFNHVLHEYSGVIDARKGNRHGSHPWGIYPCKDGYVGIIGGPERAWPQMSEFIDPRLGDERFATMAGRTPPDARDEIDAIMLPWLLEHTKAEIYRGGQERGLAFSYVATPAELLESPQTQERAAFATVDHPVAGRYAYPAAPVIIDGAPWRIGRAPLLGEHTEDVLIETLGYDASACMALAEAGIIAAQGEAHV